MKYPEVYTRKFIRTNEPLKSRIEIRDFHAPYHQIHKGMENTPSTQSEKTQHIITSWIIPEHTILSN